MPSPRPSRIDTSLVLSSGMIRSWMPLPVRSRRPHRGASSWPTAASVPGRFRRHSDEHVDRLIDQVGGDEIDAAVAGEVGGGDARRRRAHRDWGLRLEGPVDRCPVKPRRRRPHSWSTARSIRPSLLKSAAARPKGSEGASDHGRRGEVPIVVLEISTVSLSAHATARSGRPSPLKSAATTERHRGPVESC